LDINSFVITLKRKPFAILLIVILCSSITLPRAYAIGQVGWNGIPSALTDFPVDAAKVGDSPIIISVFDDQLQLNGNTEQIQVRITSGIDPVGTTLVLTETTPNSGLFEGTIVPMENNAVFQIGDTAVIRIESRCVAPTAGIGNCNPNVVDTLLGGNNLGATGAFAESDSDPGADVAIHLTETGPNTGIFEGRLKFVQSPAPSVSAPFPGISELSVSPGDTITIFDSVLFEGTNGLIAGNPAKGGLRVSGEPGVNSATITYTPVGPLPDVSETIPVDPSGSGGRGGGGLVIPTLVVDAVAPSASSSSGNGCKGDCIPPTLGVDENYNRLVTNGFSYNDHPVDVQLYYTPYPLVTVNVGERNKAVLKIYDNSGIEHIEHVGLAFGLGSGQIFGQSKASIEIELNDTDITQVSKFDPENVFDNVTVKRGIDRCSSFISQPCLVLEIGHTFRAPLDFNMVSTMVWDKDRNAWQNYYNHGVEVIGKSMNPPKQYIGIYRGHQISITETEKNKAIDQDGNTWTFDKEWNRDYVPPQKIDYGPTSHGYDRDSAGFENYKKIQLDIAKEYFDSSSIEGKKPISQTIDFPNYGRLHDSIPNMSKALLEYLLKSSTSEQ
jgi:hypothetical protein